MSESTTTSPKLSLYERIGGEPGLRKIVNEILDKNFNNPPLTARKALNNYYFLCTELWYYKLKCKYYSNSN